LNPHTASDRISWRPKDRGILEFDLVLWLIIRNFEELKWACGCAIRQDRSNQLSSCIEVQGQGQNSVRCNPSFFPIGKMPSRRRLRSQEGHTAHTVERDCFIQEGRAEELPALHGDRTEAQIKFSVVAEYYA
jgi:hypothetical protein